MSDHQNDGIPRRDFLVSSAAAAGAISPLASAALAASEGKTEVEVFAEQVGSHFELSDDQAQTIKVKLVEAEATQHQPSAGHRQSFALLFRLPDGVDAPQGNYQLKHARLGRMQLMLTPVVTRGEHKHLEAVIG